MKRILPYLLAALVAVLLSYAWGASAQKTERVPATTIPCGVRQQLLLEERSWSVGNATFTVEFDARGGGNVWLVVPPNQGNLRVTADPTFRHYSFAVTANPNGQNPVPVQVLAHNEAQGCTAPMEINNVVVTQGSPAR